MVVVVFPPIREQEVVGQALYLFVVENYKLLVGGRVNEERIAFPSEDVLQAHRHVNGMLGDVEVEAVGEQCVELYAYEASLCHEGSVLFCDAEEVRMGFAAGEDDGFAAERAYLSCLLYRTRRNGWQEMAG